MRHFPDALEEVIGIGRWHALDHDHRGRSGLKGFLEKLFALHGAHIFREIGEDIIVCPGADVAEQGRN